MNEELNFLELINNPYVKFICFCIISVWCVVYIIKMFRKK